MNERGSETSAFIVFECLETLMKHEARVYGAKLQNTPQLTRPFKSCYRSPAVDIIYILSIYKPHEIYRFLLCSLRDCGPR